MNLEIVDSLLEVKRKQFYVKLKILGITLSVNI